MCSTNDTMNYGHTTSIVYEFQDNVKVEIELRPIWYETGRLLIILSSLKQLPACCKVINFKRKNFEK